MQVTNVESKTDKTRIKINKMNENQNHIIILPYSQLLAHSNAPLYVDSRREVGDLQP